MWPRTVTDLISELVRREICLKRYDAGQHRAPCPECRKSARDDALAVKIDGEGATWTCHRCGWTGSARGRVGWKPGTDERSPSSSSDRGSATKTERARRLIRIGSPIINTPAHAYLRGRGIDTATLNRLAPGALLFIRDTWHWPTQTRRPVMIGRIVNIQTNEIQGAHQTFLTPNGDGKADVEHQRLYLGPKAGGCIKLTEDSEVTTGLAVAEGIETALSGMMAGYPTWALLDAGNLAAFPVLNGIESLTILADNDENGRGQEAAESCARRWHEAGREVRVAVPALAGSDWNDRLMKGSNDGRR